MPNETNRLMTRSKLWGNGLRFTAFIDLKRKSRSISGEEGANRVEIHLFENGRGQEGDHIQKCVDEPLP